MKQRYLHKKQRLQGQLVTIAVVISADLTDHRQRIQRRHLSRIIMLLRDRIEQQKLRLPQTNGMVVIQMTKQPSSRCGMVTKVGTHGRNVNGKMVINECTLLQGMQVKPMSKLLH